MPEISATYRWLKLEELDTSLSSLRLIRPGQISAMVRSLECFGQLQPVIVRECIHGFQLLDGFKRYFASEQTGRAGLFAQLVETTEASGKAMILTYNRASNSLLDYEESLVVYSLKYDHLLSQKEIATLLGSSTSWVCRRLSLKERLDATVQSQLRLGRISSAHAKEIIKLQRCNQNEVTRSIIANNITSRQAAILVELYLRSVSNKERGYLLSCPVEAIEKSLQDRSVYDARLSNHGNRLLRSVETLSVQQYIFTSQFSHHHTSQLTEIEREILKPKIKRLSETSYKVHLQIQHNKTFSQ